MDRFIPNVQGCSKYHISKDGELYSIFSGTRKVVKPVIRSNGYVHNLLTNDNGNKVKFYRHRLVATVYIPNPDNKPQVCHKDNNPLNNNVGNLYWGTREDNMRQCISDNRFYFVGKYRKKSVDESGIVKKYKNGVLRKYILKEYNISTGVFYDVLRSHGIIPDRYGKKAKDSTSIPD